MTFLHAAMLGGAALVAVPILLHLVMRQQPKLAEFPAMRFIKRREHSNRRRIQLRHLLLLALRCAIIALLALALARPSMKASGFLADQEAPSAVAMVFDTSPRMDYRHQNKTRLELARETALWLLPQLPPQSDVAVLDGGTSEGVFAVDVSAARQRIRRLTASAVAQPVARLLDDAVRLVVESDKSRKEIYVLTDLTRPGWSGEATRALKRRLESLRNVAIYLIDVGVDSPQNFGLAPAPRASSVVPTGSLVRLGAELVNTGQGGTRTVELHLEDDHGRFQKRSEEAVAVEPGTARHLEFRLGVLPTGVQQGFLKISEEDALAADDRCNFSIEVKPPAPIIIASGGNPEQQGFFLAEALAPRALRLKGEATFDCRLLPIGKLPENALRSAAAVCLVDPPAIQDGIWRQLGSYVASGGGLAIFLGRNARVEAFNQPAAQELLPAHLLRQRKAADDAFYLSPKDLQHPVFATLRGRESTIPWDGMPVFRHWQLGSLKQGVNVIAPFSSGLPAITESTIGKGRVITLTTSVSDPPARRDAWNLLLTGEESWPFFVLVNELMLYLTGEKEQRLSYNAGETAVLALPEALRSSLFVLTTPRGDRLRQAGDQKRSALVVTTTDVPGNYRATTGGDSGRTQLGFSVNLAAETSDLVRVGEHDLKAVFGEVPFRVARNREEIDRSVSVARLGRELYAFLIVLLAIALAAEQILSNRFYRHEQPEEQAARSDISSMGAGRAAEPRSEEVATSAP